MKFFKTLLVAVFCFSAVILNGIQTGAANKIGINHSTTNSTYDNGTYTFTLHSEEDEESKKGNLTIKDSNNAVIAHIETEKYMHAIIAGNKIYYHRIKNNKPQIVYTDATNGKTTVLKTYSKKYAPDPEYYGDITLHLVDMRGSDLYFQLKDIKTKEENFTIYNTYKININTKKVSLVAKDSTDVMLFKNRLIYVNNANDYGPMPMYSVTLNGKDKKTSKYYMIKYEVLNNKLYFAGIKGGFGGNYGLYTAAEKLDNIKKIADIKNTGNNMPIVSSITDKEVYYFFSDADNNYKLNFYKLNLKTKKTISLKEEAYSKLIDKN